MFDSEDPLEQPEPADPKEALFAEAAAQVQAGQPVAAVLAQHPQYHAELELLLGTVAAVQAARLKAGGTGQIAGWSAESADLPLPTPTLYQPRVVVSPTPAVSHSRRRVGLRVVGPWVIGLIVLGGLGFALWPLLKPAPVASHLLSYNDPVEAIAGDHWRIAGKDVLIGPQTRISGTPVVGAVARGVGEEITGGSRALTIRLDPPPTLTVPVAQAVATPAQVSAVINTPAVLIPLTATDLPAVATVAPPTATAVEATATTVAPTVTDTAVAQATPRPTAVVAVHKPTATPQRATTTGKLLPTRPSTPRPKNTATPSATPTAAPQPAATTSLNPGAGRPAEPTPLTSIPPTSTPTVPDSTAQPTLPAASTTPSVTGNAGPTP